MMAMMYMLSLECNESFKLLVIELDTTEGACSYAETIEERYICRNESLSAGYKIEGIPLDA